VVAFAQASLQSFAWTEEHRARVRAERTAQCGSDLQREAVLAEPVFCFETACKALYWSILVYRLQARPLHGMSEASQPTQALHRGAGLLAVVPAPSVRTTSSMITCIMLSTLSLQSCSLGRTAHTPFSWLGVLDACRKLR